MKISTVGITINHQRHEIEPGLIPGSQLIALAGLQASQQLLLDVHNDLDIPILDQDHLFIQGDEVFAIGDGTPPIEENPCLRKPIRFQLNGDKIPDDRSIRHPKITGAEIKQMDTHGDPSDGLFMDLHGLADEPIRDDQRILVRSKDRFITTPCGNVGLDIAPNHPIRAHFDMLCKQYPHALLHPAGSQHLVVIPDYTLPEHMMPDSGDLMIMVPDGYPLAGLDMFFLSPAVTLTDGRRPAGGEGHVDILGRQWQQMSWHYQRPWNPNRDTLLTHLHFCNARLLRAE